MENEAEKVFVQQAQWLVSDGSHSVESRQAIVARRALPTSTEVL
jgi:hypothetical protein